MNDTVVNERKPEAADAATATPDAAPAWAVALIERLAALESRIAALEPGGAPALLPAAAAPAPAPAAAAAEPPAKAPATEEEMVYIAAAVAAYLGVRARIKQVRLVQSAAWAQVGRATIHASHRVHS